MNEWIVTIDAATPQELDNDVLIAMDEHAEEFNGTCGARGLDGAGITFRFAIDYTVMHQAIELGAELATKLASGAGIDELSIVSAVAETPEVAEARAFRPDTPELLAATDVAEILDVSRQRVHQLAERADFPAPYTRLGSGPIWTRPAIEAFDQRWTRKPGRPARAAS